MALTDTLADVRRVARGPLRRLFVGQFFKELGAGLTLAQFVVYLSVVRDLGIPWATGLLAWQAILALAISPLFGTIVDRVGPRPVVLAGALIEAVGVFLYRSIDTRELAFVAASVVAIGAAALWGPMTALIARLAPPADRSTAYGLQFMLTNLGLGLGGLISALIIDTAVPESFVWLYTATALSYVALFVAVLSMGRVAGRLPEAPVEATRRTPRGGWREVLRDRTLLRFTLITLVMTTVAYGSIDGGLALFITRSLGLPTGLTGIAFAVNTTIIVVMQLFVLKLIEGRSRSRILAVVAALWGGTWLLMAAANQSGIEGAAVALLLMAIAVFAVGETMFSPVAPALLNDLAPEHLRGRYNSMYSLVWGVSSALGPLIAGAFLNHSLAGGWTLTLALGSAVAVVLALSLRTRLTREQDGVGGPQAASSDPDPGSTVRQDVH